MTANAVSKVPQHDMLLIIRDLNAKVRDDNSGKEDATTLENDFFNFGSTTDSSEQQSGKIEQNLDFTAVVEKSISFIFWHR